MCNTLERVFFVLYPSNPKQAHTEEGFWLRRMLFLAAFCHFGLTITALVIIGFWSMFFNVVQLCSSYSCYLTLRERQIWVYMITLLFQITHAICCVLGLTDHQGERENSSMHFLGKLITLIICVIVGWLVGKACYDFRKSGGLHGILPGG